MHAGQNPFRSTRVESLRFRAPGFCWDRLLERLATQQGRGAIRGENGRGKTTLLLELAERLGRQGYDVRRLRPDLDSASLARRQVRALAREVSPETALLLDGADRVGVVEWRRLRWAARAAGVFVVTTHREGRLPTLHRCASSVELLSELVGELVEPGQGEADSMRELFHAERGDVRMALRVLYDRAAAG